MKHMSRAHSVGSFVVVLALGAPAYAFEQDGPPPINTTRSVSAGADDDITPHGDLKAQELSEHSGHVVGSYMGVAPGAAGVPPRAAGNRPVHAGGTGTGAGKAKPVTITWPGFQMRADGSSRVFIQSTAPIAPQATAVTGKYQVRLPGARIAAATNRLPLDTRYFNTPATKVSLSVDQSGATLLIDLRGEVTPHVSSESDKTGYFFTYIDLPAGSYLPKDAHATQQTTAGAERASTANAVPTQAGAQASAKSAAPAAASGTVRKQLINHKAQVIQEPGRMTLPD